MSFGTTSTHSYRRCDVGLGSVGVLCKRGGNNDTGAEMWSI